MNLSKREETILRFLERNLDSSITEIFDYLILKDFNISKITLNRDLSKLVELEIILRRGQGKTTKYKLSNKYRLSKRLNILEYFAVDSDDRQVVESFNFELFDVLAGIFLPDELEELEELNSLYRENLAQSSKTIVRKELERLVIDLSWKSSKLEGNTYTLLDTERLIKENIETRGHSREEAVMILNHKKALDHVIVEQQSFKNLQVDKIIKIHSMLVKDLDIEQGLRKKKVGIIGTKYKPLATKKEIMQALESLCDLINSHESPLAKALFALVMISYIQAFEDGNKRTARIISTAILLAYNYCPLSYRNVDEYDYKKALILFYEQNNIAFIKEIFINQFRFSVKEYF